MRAASILKYLLGAALLAAIGVSLATLPMVRLSDELLHALKCLGPIGAAAFVLVYLLVCLLCLPTTPLSLAAGFLFGLIFGTFSAVAGLLAGAAAGCLTSRYLFRDWFQRRLAGHPQVVAIERALARSGFKVIVLLRLCPLFPFGVMNYVLGLLPVGMGRFLGASLLGRLPATLAYVYLGSAARDLGEILSGRVVAKGEEQAIFFFGLATLLIALAVLTRIARDALRESLGEP